MRQSRVITRLRAGCACALQVTSKPAPLRPQVRGRPVKGHAKPSSVELRSAGPAEEAPDYRAVDESLLNRFILSRFRTKMVAALGQDVTSSGYDKAEVNLL